MSTKQTNNRPPLGKRIVLARKHRGFSQVELAEAMDVTQQTIVIWEGSRDNLRSDTLVKLANILAVSVDSLLGRKEFEEEAPQNIRLWRKLLQVESLSGKDRKVITEMIDALVARKNANS